MNLLHFVTMFHLNPKLCLLLQGALRKLWLQYSWLGALPLGFGGGLGVRFLSFGAKLVNKFLLLPHVFKHLLPLILSTVFIVIYRFTNFNGFRVQGL